MKDDERGEPGSTGVSAGLLANRSQSGDGSAATELRGASQLKQGSPRTSAGLRPSGQENRTGEGREEKKGFIIFERDSNKRIQIQFEFNQLKTMHQHVCKNITPFI
jgi:hypothetical protein